MYHLFNDVYVESELFATTDVDRINLSKVTGFEYMYTISDNPGVKQLGFAQCLEDLEGTEFDTLFTQAAKHDGKLYIYADSDSYCRLYSVLLKTLFPQIDYETYRFFFICKKAVVDGRAATSYRPKSDPLNGVRINQDEVDRLWACNDELFIKTFKALVTDPEVLLSLEWAVLKMLTKGYVGRIPQRLKNMMRRVVLSVVHETLGSVGFVVTDQSRWDFLGCNAETLLQADNIFQGCTNLGYLNNKIFVGQSSLSTQVPDSWLIELMGQLIEMLKIQGEVKTWKFSENLLEMWVTGWKLETPEAVYERLTQIFSSGERTVSLPHHDLGKYDENLIRHLLRTPPAKLAKLMEDATW